MERLIKTNMLIKPHSFFDYLEIEEIESLLKSNIIHFEKRKQIYKYLTFRKLLNRIPLLLERMGVIKSIG